MKKAKVSNGVIHHVWPWVKILPDGTRVTKELPPHYRGRDHLAEGCDHQFSEEDRHCVKCGGHLHGGKSPPDCLIDVPDDVQPGWVWDEAQKKYAPIVKKPIPEAKIHSDLLQVVSEKLGIPYDDLWKEVMDRKRTRKANKAKTKAPKKSV